MIKKLINRLSIKNSLFHYFFINSAIQILFILTTVIILSVIYYSFSDMFSVTEKWNLQEIYTDYKKDGQELTIKKHNLPPTTVIEILNKNKQYSEYYRYVSNSNNYKKELEETFEENRIHEKPDRDLITRENEFHINPEEREEDELENLNSKNLEEYIKHELKENSMDSIKFHPKNSKDLMLVYFPSNLTHDEKMKFLFALLTLSFVLIFVFIIIQAKVTASKLIDPLQLIINNVSKISEGNYSTIIKEDIKNYELNLLKIEINDMIKKINMETRLKENIENNRKRLILDISHDLKTPLTSIMGYIETLENLKNIDEKSRKKYFKIIKQCCQKANKLISDLFAYSQMDSPEYKMKFNNEDIFEFLKNILVGYIDELGEKKMSYDFNMPDEEIYLSINLYMLERAISNIIVNSIKYSGENTELSFSAFQKDNSINIIIQDNGVGIPEEYAKNIFEPFTRVDESRSDKTGGSGLGLSISKKIIEKHKGSISIDSSYKEGCRFIIILPIL